MRNYSVEVLVKDQRRNMVLTTENVSAISESKAFGKAVKQIRKNMRLTRPCFMSYALRSIRLA